MNKRKGKGNDNNIQCAYTYTFVTRKLIANIPVRNVDVTLYIYIISRETCFYRTESVISGVILRQ